MLRKGKDKRTIKQNVKHEITSKIVDPKIEANIQTKKISKPKKKS